MREGYWINYAATKTFDIDEHERWLRVPGNARKLGVPKDVIAMFGKFKPVKDRDKFLMFVMKHAPVMRVRGHGSDAAFEYNSSSRRDPMDAIWLFGKENFGPYTTLHIVNFATSEKVDILFKTFEEAVDAGGYDAVMRVAGSTFVVRRAVAREVERLSMQLPSYVAKRNREKKAVAMELVKIARELVLGR